MADKWVRLWIHKDGTCTVRQADSPIPPGFEGSQIEVLAGPPYRVEAERILALSKRVPDASKEPESYGLILQARERVRKLETPKKPKPKKKAKRGRK